MDMNLYELSLNTNFYEIPRIHICLRINPSRMVVSVPRSLEIKSRIVVSVPRPPEIRNGQ